MPFTPADVSFVLTYALFGYAALFSIGKFLLMLQSIKRAQEVDHENGELHSIIVDFVLACESSKIRSAWGCRCPPTSQLLCFFFLLSDDAAKQGLPGQVQEVVEANQHCLTEGRSLVELNREFLERHKDSLDHMIPGM